MPTYCSRVPDGERDPAFHLEVESGDRPSKGESVDLNHTSFEKYNALEWFIRPWPLDGVRRLHRRELGVDVQDRKYKGGKGYLIDAPSLYEDRWPKKVWPPVSNARMIWIRVVEHRQRVLPLSLESVWEKHDTYDSMYFFPYYTSVRQFALEVMGRYATMSFHEDYRTTCRIVEQGEDFPNNINWDLTYARAPHYINEAHNSHYVDEPHKEPVIRNFWINPFQRIWLGEYMDDVFHLHDDCHRDKPICVWIWNAYTHGAPRSPPCASKFKDEPCYCYGPGGWVLAN